jgi:hypothetical protein
MTDVGAASPAAPFGVRGVVWAWGLLDGDVEAWAQLCSWMRVVLAPQSSVRGPDHDVV